MTLVCPHCSCANENPALVEGLYRCAGCGEWFNPSIRAFADAPEVESPASFAPDAPAREPVHTSSESEKISRMADGLTVLSILFALAGLIAGLVGLADSLSGNSGMLGYICAAGLIPVALCFFMTAQIVHIRAVLSKK